MAETIMWCNIMYKISFYIVLFLYFYFNITSNTIMIENSFKGLVILGLVTLIDRR
jgi:hypothetical protein